MPAYPSKNQDEQQIASHRDRSIVQLQPRWDILVAAFHPSSVPNPLSCHRSAEAKKGLILGFASLHEARKVPGTQLARTVS